MVKRKHISPGDLIFRILNGLFLCFVAFVTTAPFVYVFYKSLKNYAIDGESGLSKVVLDFSAYTYIFQNDEILSSLLLTIGVVIVSTVLHVLITLMAAYPLSKPQLKGVKFMHVFILITMMFGGGLIPTYVLITELGLRNNVLVYIIPGLVSGFNIIISKNFMASIPQSLEESARIDGASDFQIFFRIILPLSKPIMCTIGLWFAVGKWNDWMTGLLYMGSSKWLLLQNILREMLVQNTGISNNLGLGQSDKFMLMDNIKMAVVIVATVPIICVYPFVQKYFIKGTMLGAVKE